MRVVLDGRILLPRMTGAGRYVLEIGTRLPSLERDLELYVLLRSALKGTDADRALGEAGARLRYCDARVASVRQWIEIPRLLRDLRPDVYHYPFLDLPYVQCPSVVTVYDLNPVLDRAYFAHWAAVKRPLARQLLRSTLRRCRAAVTISEATRVLLEETFSEARGKTRAIPLGLSSNFAAAKRRGAEGGIEASIRHPPPWADRPYVLYVGVDRPHKNLARLVRAFAVFRGREGWETGAGPYLWLAGVGEGSRGLRVVLRESPAEPDVRLSGPLAEAVVVAAYHGASIVVYVSTSEGFGLPIIEGFASGVPVLTANVSSMPEVGGEAAFYVSPEDAQDIASGLRRLWRDGDLRRKLVALGTRRLRAFSWDVSARESLATYKVALGSPPSPTPPIRSP